MDLKVDISYKIFRLFSHLVLYLELILVKPYVWTESKTLSISVSQEKLMFYQYWNFLHIPNKLFSLKLLFTQFYFIAKLLSIFIKAQFFQTPECLVKILQASLVYFKEQWKFWI